MPTLAEAMREADLDSMSRSQILTALLNSGPMAAGAVPVVLEATKGDPIEDWGPGGEVARRGNAVALIRAARFLHTFGEGERAADILRKLARDRDSAIAREAEDVLRSIQIATPPASPKPTG